MSRPIIGKGRYKSPEPGGPKGGPTMPHMFCLSRKYFYLSIAQINPRRLSHRNFATDGQSFRFSVNFFSWSHLAVGPEKHFSPAPESAVGGRDANNYKYVGGYQ
jgi:hypothetical protein